MVKQFNSVVEIYLRLPLRVVLISRLSKYQPPTPLCQSTIKVNSIREKQIKII